ncbi:hypothetical protein [Thalassoglobus polymorphus]|uniref:Uncharacterized protein n=1 Tax=Thalassoglobus polymorphus TaxID=2527994 RepID=A0A517QUE0_9PLAN|nr:hypothetical protein [Thalassoglobus polymorphus]QDT35238.1 hypothetical protein Mal48_45140 [Thalassoglobus polymorphus]
MKFKFAEQSLRRWKTISVAGFGLTGVGLACIVLIIGQLAPPILNGEAPEVSTLEMAIEATIGLIFLVAGFTMMVIGSDPFEDSTNAFRFDQDQERT